MGLRRVGRDLGEAAKDLVRDPPTVRELIRATLGTWLDLGDPAHPAPRRTPSDAGHERRDPFRGGPPPPPVVR